jgi:hypothetical protein
MYGTAPVLLMQAIPGLHPKGRTYRSAFHFVPDKMVIYASRFQPSAPHFYLLIKPFYRFLWSNNTLITMGYWSS